MKNVTQTIQGIRAIPKDKMPSKLNRLGAGIFILGLTFMGQTQWDWGNTWSAIGFVAAGVTIWGEPFLFPFRLVWAAVKDIKNSVGSKDDEPPAAGGAAAA